MAEYVWAACDSEISKEMESVRAAEAAAWYRSCFNENRTTAGECLRRNMDCQIATRFRPGGLWRWDSQASTPAEVTEMQLHCRVNLLLP